jgi:hypothetical protein
MAEFGARALRAVGDEEGGPEDLVGEYLKTLEGRSAATVDAYVNIEIAENLTAEIAQDIRLEEGSMEAYQAD